MVGMPAKCPHVLDEVRRLVPQQGFEVDSHGRYSIPSHDVSNPDLEHVLLVTGRHAAGRDRYDDDRETWTYTLCGPDIDGRILRVVVYFQEEDILPEPFVVVKTAYDPKQK